MQNWIIGLHKINVHIFSVILLLFTGMSVMENLDFWLGI